MQSKRKPYFSVILPVYNVESYLRECIETILVQDFEDYEIILVDDGATDNCPAICDEYAEKYSNISVIHKKNGGLSSARNAGLDIAQGQYIWWVDSDDWIEEGALRKLWNASHQLMPDVVKFNYYRSGQSKEQVLNFVAPGIYYRGKGLERLTDIAFEQAGAFCLSACSHIYRRDFLEGLALSFVSEKIVGSEDYLFNLQALTRAGSIAVMEDTLYCYRLRSGSLSQSYNEGLAEKYTKLCELLKDVFKKSGNYALYEEKINYFYVWHLIYGTCISREYGYDNRESILAGRLRVKKLLCSVPLQAALANGGGTGLSLKRRIQYWALRIKFEPFFYWLFVIKPKEGTKKA